MTPWLVELHSSLDAECAGRPRIAALATVDEQGRPRVRSVVVRRIESDGAVWVCSDARSAKNIQLRANPAAEMVFWLPGRGEQFRLAGEVAVIGDGDADPRRETLWGELSQATRALFFGPGPGQSSDADAASLDSTVANDGPAPVTFELLALSPEVVEHLDLNHDPHRRRRWSRAEDWRERAVNP